MMSREIEKAMVDERKGIGFEIWNGDSTYRTNSIANEFYFVAPINADNNNTGNYKGDLSEVGYWVKEDSSDTILMRHYTSNATNFNFSNGSSNALIGNVSGLRFEYWDEINNQFTSPLPLPPPPAFYGNNTALPRAIKITLTMKYEMEKDDEREQDFTTIVNIPGSGQ